MSRKAENRAPDGAHVRPAVRLRPHAAEAAERLRAIANEQRLMILCHLVPGPLSVSELNRRVPLSQSALSQHLGVLRASGIVVSEREAQTVRYWLPEGLVTRVLAILHAEYCGSPDSGKPRRRTG